MGGVPKVGSLDTACKEALPALFTVRGTGQHAVDGLASCPGGQASLHVSPLQTASWFLHKERVPRPLMSSAVKADFSSAGEKWDGTMPKLLLRRGFRWMESPRPFSLLGQGCL